MISFLIISFEQRTFFGQRRFGVSILGNKQENLDFVEKQTKSVQGACALQVSYASKTLQAEVIVDLATLTGAQGAATGQYCLFLSFSSHSWNNQGQVVFLSCWVWVGVGHTGRKYS